MQKPGIPADEDARIDALRSTKRRDRNGSLHPVQITAVRRDRNDVFGGFVLFLEPADAR
jgi:hypothetical protein